MRRSETDKRSAALYMKTLISKWTVLTILAGIGMALYAEELIRLMAAPEYHDAYGIVPVLVAGCIMRGFYFFPANAILFEKKTHLIPVITVTSGLLNIGLNLWLIPLLGTVVVAAWTTAASLGFSFFLSWLLVRKHYPFVWPWKTIAGMSVGMGAAIAVAFRFKATDPWTGLLWKTGMLLGITLLVVLMNVGGLRQDVVTLWGRVNSRET